GACGGAGSGSRLPRLLTGTFSTELGSANAPGLHSRKFTGFRQAVFHAVGFWPVRAAGRRIGWHGSVCAAPAGNRKRFRGRPSLEGSCFAWEGRTDCVAEKRIFLPEF